MGQGPPLPAQDYSQVHHITSAAGKRLYIREWLPEGDIRALCYFCHGVAEHVERYGEFAATLNKIGVAVFGHDHVGHGRSEGIPVHVDDMNEYVTDMVQRIKLVREEHPGLPLFLLGHSMGGLIAFSTAAKNTDIIDYLILSAPAIVADPEVATPVKVTVARILAGVTPQLQLGKLPERFICRDQAVIDEIKNDPYMWHGGMKIAWGIALLAGQQEAESLFKEFKLPLLVYHGTADGLCKIEGSRQLFAEVASEDKTMKEFEGGYHELEREPDGMGDEVKQMVSDWVAERLQTASGAQSTTEEAS